MTQDAAAEQNHKTFVKDVVKNGKVWCLENDEGLALSESSTYEDTGVIPFWSDKAGAEAQIKEGWSVHKATEVSLVEFLETYIILLSNDEVMIGTNWDQDMVGKEMEPVELAIDIIAELKATGKTLSFSHYKDLAEFEKSTLEAWEFIQSLENAEEAHG